MTDELSMLVRAAQGGDLDAFGTVIGRFQNMAYAVAYTMVADAGLAEDAAQEAFLDAYFNLDKLREPAAFPGWFRRIVVKHADRQVRGKRLPAVALEAAGAVPDPDPEPAMAAETAELRGLVRAAVATLPEAERLVTVLFYLAGYSQAEIAVFLEVPVSTVKGRLHDARQRLKGRVPATAPGGGHRRLAPSGRFAGRVGILLAVRAGQLRKVEELLDRDPALVDARETLADWGALGGGEHYWPLGGGYTPLHWAATQGNLALARLLLDHGADPNPRDNGGHTPLHVAALHRHADLLALLLARGAAPAAANTAGLTPLHQAALRGHAAIVAQLLAAGAPAGARDAAGRTARQWALLKGHQAIVALLRQAKGTEGRPARD